MDFSRRQFLATTLAVGLGATLPAAEPEKKWRVAVIGHTGRGDYGHGIDILWKGMPETDVNAMFGDPRKRNVKRVEGMDVVDSSYALPEAELAAQFVNGVLTKFAITGK